MYHLKILSIGKTKEKWLDDAIGEYTKRLRPYLKIEMLWAKDNAQLIDWTRKESSYLCLDPKGKTFTSEKFSKFIIKEWEKGGSHLTMVIGGAEGLPSELQKNGLLISLSLLTFTHQITRLVLVEQIYRALEIHRGSAYHKE